MDLLEKITGSCFRKIMQFDYYVVILTKANDRKRCWQSFVLRDTYLGISGICHALLACIHGAAIERYLDTHQAT